MVCLSDKTQTEIHLIPRKLNPENHEFPMLSQTDWVTPEPLFYVRNHLNYPNVDLEKWTLSIEGFVNQELKLSYSDLLSMRQVELPMTLECSGNKRSYFHPQAEGEQWNTGAISHAIWSGVPLRDVLQLAGIASETVEVAFEGLDVGERPDLPGLFSYGRSLPVDKALHPDVLLATSMNGHPIPFKHGYPVRLLVPGWYGMASVKWLHRIVAMNRPFRGPFQVIDYVFVYTPDDPIRTPVSEMQINSAIAYPSDQEVLKHGTHLVHGVAWSGPHPATAVEISTDNGKTWTSAQFLDPVVPYSWRRFHFKWDTPCPGTYHLQVKATDALGHSQPYEARWNEKGYVNNSIQQITVHVK